MYTFLFILALLYLSTGQFVDEKKPCGVVNITCECRRGENLQRYDVGLVKSTQHIVARRSITIVDLWANFLRNFIFGAKPEFFPFKSLFRFTRNVVARRSINIFDLWAKFLKNFIFRARPEIFPTKSRYMAEDETGDVSTGVPDPYETCKCCCCKLSTDKNLIDSNKDSPDIDHNSTPFLGYYNPHRKIIPTKGSLDVTNNNRKSKTCIVQHVKAANIKCKRWKNWVTCDVHCIPIHGMLLLKTRETVRRMHLECKPEENIWKPQAFPECKPFRNCKAHLIQHGSLKCQDQVYAPPYCEIECYKMGNLEAVPLKRYDCLSWRFAKQLPRCAAIYKNVSIIPEPEETAKSQTC